MFFGTVVMVDGEQDTSGGQRRRAQQQRGFAAVGADLYTDPVVEVLQRRMMQGLPLVCGHESGDPLGQFKQPVGALSRLGDRSHHANLVVIASAANSRAKRVAAIGLDGMGGWGLAHM
jgi:hypothetical protein